MSTDLRQPVTVERDEPDKPEIEGHSVHTHYRIGSGLWFFLSICVVCVTAFYILVGMGLVHLDLIRAHR